MNPVEIRIGRHGPLALTLLDNPYYIFGVSRVQKKIELKGGGC